MPCSLWECVCHAFPNATPSAQEVLRRLTERQECTSTQCFDELVHLHVPSMDTNTWLLLGFLAGVFGALVVTRAPSRNEARCKF